MQKYTNLEGRFSKNEKSNFNKDDYKKLDLTVELKQVPNMQITLETMSSKSLTERLEKYEQESKLLK